MKKLVTLLLTLSMILSLIGGVAVAEEKPTLVCWTILNPESDADPRNIAFRKIIENWNATNEWGATMTVNPVNWSDLHKQFTQAAASGTSPDVVCAFSTNLDQYIAAGGLQPMTEMAKAWLAETGDDYIFNADMLTKVDGEIYSLPWETRTMALYYRTDVYGEEAPFTSLTDLVTKAAAQSGDGHYGFVLGCHGDDGFLQQLQPVLYAFGAATYDSSGKVVINSEEALNCFGWLKELYDAGVMDIAAVDMNIEDTFNGMKAGTIDAIILGTHRYGAVTNTDVIGDLIATCAVPGVEEGSVAPAYNTCQTLGIGLYSKYPEIAFDFIASNVTTQGSYNYFEASCMPVRKSVYDLEETKTSDNAAVMASWQEIWETGKDTFFFEPEYNAELSTVVAEAVQKYIITGSDLKADLDEIADTYNAKYNSGK